MKGMNNICSINQKWVREPSLDPLKASGFERLITGSYLDPINRIIVNDKMKIPVVGKNHNITIHFNNNNVKSVTR